MELQQIIEQAWIDGWECRNESNYFNSMMLKDKKAKQYSEKIISYLSSEFDKLQRSVG